MKGRFCLTIYVIVFICGAVFGQNGYELWLRYAPVADENTQKYLQGQFRAIYLDGNSATMQAIERELQKALPLALNMPFKKATIGFAGLVIAPTDHPAIVPHVDKNEKDSLGTEGFLIKHIKYGGNTSMIITANTQIGLLYGVYHMLRLMYQPGALTHIRLLSRPALKLRMLNHWDNLNRTVERGYAGQSIWNWHTLPDFSDNRYTDYARANASLGINATVLTNVNANATVLTPMYLEKVKALADVLRPYGIRVFLTARFSAPIEIGGVKTADPLSEDVRQWWNKKVTEIYKLIPDFGGFLVKANSEGQPGPQNYGRSHADGANMLAAALAPHRGMVIWRAFVYSNETPEDRFKQPYSEFVPLDGAFASNVLLQVKNGPIDFQPREPFHPLFGAMARTPVMMEFQLTQEYLGFATHLVYLAPMFREVLDSDTYRPQQGSTVAHVLMGKSYAYAHTGMAGVANIGSDLNWTGHPFGQSNWYALGRLAWDVQLSSQTIAQEWISQTITQDKQAVDIIQSIMMDSHENLVQYMTPMGLHHIMGYGHHYGPAPWFDKASRDDWNCTYFHRADDAGLGFNRTSSGSNALAQYAMPLQQQWGNLHTTSSKWLTWFHHVPWNFNMGNQKTFWDSLCVSYQQGVNGVRLMRKQWNSVKQYIDSLTYRQVEMLLEIQEKEAIWWKDACLSYFRTFSQMKIPAEVEQPAFSLDYYKQLTFPYAPGNTH